MELDEAIAFYGINCGVESQISNIYAANWLFPRFALSLTSLDCDQLYNRIECICASACELNSYHIAIELMNFRFINVSNIVRRLL